MLNKKFDTFCTLAWNHIQVLPSTEIRPCCRFLYKEVPDEYKKSINNLAAATGGQFIKDIRLKMLNGEKVAGCQKCYEEELAQKNLSIRQLYNRKGYNFSDFRNQSEHKLEFIELASNNTCNLKCMICSPLFSTKWYEDADMLGIDYEKKINQVVSSEILSEHLNTLKLIKFTGGEPLLIKDYTHLLSTLVEKKLSNSIVLNYSMNGTVFPTQIIIDLWKQFKFVEITLSLDGVGTVAEYGRYPLKWTNFDLNVQKFLKLKKSNIFDLRIGARPSVSIYNIFDLINITDYWIENCKKNDCENDGIHSWFNPTHVQMPEIFSVQNLPKELKEQLTLTLKTNQYSKNINQSLQHINNYMLAVDGFSTQWGQFLKYTKSVDKIRSRSFVQIYPQLERYWSV